jgi:hypothetical protein
MKKTIFCVLMLTTGVTQLAQAETSPTPSKKDGTEVPKDSDNPAGESRPQDRNLVLGPRGEIPLGQVDDATIAQIAESGGMTIEEARYSVGPLSVVVQGFQDEFGSDPEFGGIWVDHHPLQVRLRVARGDGLRIRQTLEKRLGRKAGMTKGGLAYGELLRTTDSVSAMANAHRSSGRNTIEPDLINGVVEAHLEDPVTANEVRKAFPKDHVVVVEDKGSDFSPTSWSGAEIHGDGSSGTGFCSVGIAVRRKTDGFRGVVTAAHCPDGPWTGRQYAAGSPLYPAELEDCSRDFQLHPTYAPQVWGGLYNQNSTWYSIKGIAGGGYFGQSFFRRGQHTTSTGRIKWPLVTQQIPVGIDCPNGYSVLGINALSDPGQNPGIPGDSGGVVVLIWNNQYYYAGQASASGVSQGEPATFVAWNSTITGWDYCTTDTRIC